MTVCEDQEHEPLLVEICVGQKKSSYSSLSNENGTHGPALHMERRGLSPPGNPGLAIPMATNSQRVSYTWHDIHVETSGVETRQAKIWRRLRNLAGANMAPSRRKKILRGVNGAAYPGELTALMGASGAGKTTLLNVLTFRTGGSLEVSGLRAVNGVPVESDELTGLSAYVQQDDLFVDTLTVREHLVFQALVRMDRHIPYHQRMARVAEVISELALTKCENTVIGSPGRMKGISGGEMKRLSFASEVLTDPPLMFCDEPTSGLDSYMAQNVVSVLKAMAMKGKTVICTIHQPSSEVFAMFDKVLLLAEGRLAYLGTSRDACDFFQNLGAACPTNYNPADFFMKVLAVVPHQEESCRESIGLVCDAFDQSPEGQQLDADTALHPVQQLWDSWGSNRKPSPYKASWIAQFRAVLWRSWLSVMKEPILIQVRLIHTVLISLITSLLFYNQQLTHEGVMNINGALFLFLTNMTFENVFAVTNVFCLERPVFLREHFNGMYRVDVYFLCKSIADIPIFLAMPIIYTTITYYAIGLYPGFDHFLRATLVIVLVTNTATSFGYLISCVCSDITMALSIGPPIIIPFLIFGGFYLNSGSVPRYLKWLEYISWFRSGNEALLINQWSDVTEIDCTRFNATCPRNGQVILETLGFKTADFYLNIISLVVLIVAFRFLAYLALLCRAWRSD